VSDALSIDSIKKKMGQQAKLIDYFYKQFGDRKSKSKDCKKFKIIFRIQESKEQLLLIFGSLLSCVFCPSD
jgi:hypothetical protein